MNKKEKSAADMFEELAKWFLYHDEETNIPSYELKRYAFEKFGWDYKNDNRICPSNIHTKAPIILVLSGNSVVVFLIENEITTKVYCRVLEIFKKGSWLLYLNEELKKIKKCAIRRHAAAKRLEGMKENYERKENVRAVDDAHLFSDWGDDDN